MITTSRALSVPAEKLAIASPQEPLGVWACVKLISEGNHPDLPKVRLSQAQLASKIGYAPSALSAASKGRYTGNQTLLERKIEDLIKLLIYESHKTKASTDLFSTIITDKVERYLNTIKKQGFMGRIIGTPGLGKTSGVQLYLSKNALDVSVRLNAALHPGSKGGIVAAFWDSPNFSTAGWRRSGKSRSAFITYYFIGQKRLIIVDNAHTLSKGGLDWLVGFHEATGCPVALVGNSELQDTILKVERALTHCAFSRDAEFEDSTAGHRAFEEFADDAVSKFVELHWSDHKSAVRPLARKILIASRNLRSLRNVSQLARQMMDNGARQAEQAWRAAAALQIQDYKLAV